MCYQGLDVTLPTPATLFSAIESISSYEFLIKPAAAIALIYSGIPSAFWLNKSVYDLCSIYNQLTVTNRKVLNLLVSFEAKSANEACIYGYLTSMIGNMNRYELRSLLRFITW